jgi:hypothetical protein
MAREDNGGGKGENGKRGERVSESNAHVVCVGRRGQDLVHGIDPVDEHEPRLAVDRFPNLHREHKFFKQSKRSQPSSSSSSSSSKPPPPPLAPSSCLHSCLHSTSAILGCSASTMSMPDRSASSSSPCSSHRVCAIFAISRLPARPCSFRRAAR